MAGVKGKVGTQLQLYRITIGEQTATIARPPLKLQKPDRPPRIPLIFGGSRRILQIETRF
jgi:hypothetical protein